MGFVEAPYRLATLGTSPPGGGNREESFASPWGEVARSADRGQPNRSPTKWVRFGEEEQRTSARRRCASEQPGEARLLASRNE